MVLNYLYLRALVLNVQSVHVEYTTTADKLPEPMFVRMPNGQREIYYESKCHPLFIPKYSTIQKFVGGIAHIATFGVSYFAVDKPWPGFTNNDEECVNCKGPPGSNGCIAIQKDYEYHSEDGKNNVLKVQHSSNIEHSLNDSSIH